MNNRKNQNSILVLATLGVYLGLLLAGGTPQILAQAATAKQFSVKDETEHKDDLDKKPNPSNFEDSIQTYLFHVESFLENLYNLQTRGIYGTGRDTFEFSHATALPCAYSPSGLKEGLNYDIKFDVKNLGLWNSVASLSNRLTTNFALADCLPSARLEGRNQANLSNTKTVFDRYSFSIELGFKKSSSTDAAALSNGLTSALDSWDLDDISSVQKEIIASTSFRSENDQVFVVTRLPRGSLDSLLASDAK